MSAATPTSPGVLSDSTESQSEGGSFRRPKINMNVANIAAGLSGLSGRFSVKSEFSDISDSSFKDSSVKTEHMSLSGMLAMTASSAAAAAAGGGGARARRNEGASSLAKKTSSARGPLKLSIKSTQIVEADDEEAGGDEFDGGIRGAGRGGRGFEEVVAEEPADSLHDLNSYHIAYLMGVSAGAKAAAEGPIGGQSTDESAWEGSSSKTGRRATGTGALAGGGGGGAAGGRRRGAAPSGPGGDDVYMLGFQHGRSHGASSPGTAFDDLESGEGLSIDERIQRLRDQNRSHFSEVETVWDSPTTFEQFLLDYCICRGITERICCSSGFLCFSREIVDAFLVVLCFFGSIIAMLVLMSIFNVF